METGIDRRLVGRFTGGRDREGVEQETGRTASRLFAIALFQRIGQFQQRLQPRRLRHDEVPQVCGQGGHEVQGVEAFAKNFVKNQESLPGKL